MRGLWRAWKTFQARSGTEHGYSLYEIGRTTAGRPVRVDASTWSMIQRDPSYGQRLINQAELMDKDGR